MKENVKDNLYFDEDCLIEDDYYRSIKSMIICGFCNKTLKEPMMCSQCQGGFCKACTEKFKKKNDKHKCKKPKYKPYLNISSILGKIKYLCKNCKYEIKQEDIENHLKNGCEKNENPTKLLGVTYKKNLLKKLNEEEKSKLSENSGNVSHISGKINNLIIFLFSSIIGKKWCWKIFVN
jgi:hypothetical protein